MKIFVTGAAGGIGSALVSELLSAGHTVLGLSRSDAGAEKLRAIGAEVVRGSLEDFRLLEKTAAECDAVAHLAFGSNFAEFVKSCETDRAAISALGSGLAAAAGGDNNKALVMTSGTMVLEKDKIVTEADAVDMASPIGATRGTSEGVALGFVERGLRVCVMRLPPVVHGGDGAGFVQLLLKPALETKSVPYVGAGENRWCAVHRLDAAKAYRLALEKGGKFGSVFHVVCEEGVPTKDIAETVGKKLDLPVASVTPEEAQQVFGPLAGAVASDNPASSAKTREELGWSPVHEGLIKELEGDLLPQILKDQRSFF